MAAKQQAVEDFSRYADKSPTGTMDAFADWLIDEVYGGEFPGTQKDEKAFRNGVRLGGTLRMEFQASDYWRADERNPRSPAGKKARASANGAGPVKGRGRGKAQADPEPEDTEDEQEAPAKQPARRGRPAGSKTTTAAKGRGKAAAPKGRPASGTRRGRPAASATADGGEAPY